MKLYSALYRDFHPLDVFFPKASCAVVDKPGQMDQPGILILHGGTDIQPSLYGKGRSSRTYDGAFQRDAIEWELIKEAKEKNILICGWCRGAQLLCAAAGGYQLLALAGHQVEAHKHLVEVRVVVGACIAGAGQHQAQAGTVGGHQRMFVKERPHGRLYAHRGRLPH